MTGLYIGVFLLASALLGLEITLTRVFALAQWYHFSFVAISLALLGSGAGGTILAIKRELQEHPQRTATAGAFGCGISIICSYLLANYLPYDVYLIAIEPVQILYLALYYAALAVPFFFASLSTGALLSGFMSAGNRIYAVNLLGSAAGCLMAPLALKMLGGPGAIACWAALSALAVAVFAHQRCLTAWRYAGVAFAAGCAILSLYQPVWFEVRLSPHKSLSQTLRAPNTSLISQRWNAISRVDLVSSPSLHAAPGISLSCQAVEPPQQAVFVDGDNPSAVLLTTPKDLTGWADCLPLALAFHLRPSARTLVVEPGGNLDVLAAQSLGAGTVTVIEPNELLVAASSGHPGANVSIESGRAYLLRTTQRFDIIDLALSGARNVVSTGAFSLSEEYRYTLEAVRDALVHLDDGGLLVFSRWLQSPPSEELRAWALAVTALEKAGSTNVRQRLVAYRSWSTLTILVKHGDYTAQELAAVREFCAQRQFDLVYLPDIKPEEANRYNVYPEDPYYHRFSSLLSSNTREAFFADQKYDVRPPTDDRPFFYHFFTWNQVPDILNEMGHTWKPFGGSGYLVLFALLAVTLLFGLILVLLPLVTRARLTGKGLGWTAAYFGFLGVGYLAVEIPLIQRFILYFGNATLAFAAIAAFLLLFSGIGSLLSRRIQPQWLFPVLITVLVLTICLTKPVFTTLASATLINRLLAAGILLAPLGVLMGMPFALGISWLETRNPQLIPWAWAINGCASVVTSVGVAMAALSFGLSVVFVAAAAAYLCAGVAGCCLCRYHAIPPSR